MSAPAHCPVAGGSTYAHAAGAYIGAQNCKALFRGGGPTMAAKDRTSGGSGFGKAGEAARAARNNRYIERLIEDEELRGSLLAAYGAARSAYGRMSNGKPATTALFEDRKLQNELREAAGALRDAANTLREPRARPASAAADSAASCCCSGSPACSRSRSARICAGRSSTCCSAPRRSSSTARPPLRPSRRPPPLRPPEPEPTCPSRERAQDDHGRGERRGR